MAHPYHHAISSVKKWGGQVEDYLPIHDWFDESKSHMADFRHRALRHHSEGIFMAEKIFGHTITNSDGREVMVRYIGEQHVQEDLRPHPVDQRLVPADRSPELDVRQPQEPRKELAAAEKEETECPTPRWYERRPKSLRRRNAGNRSAI
jgi:hypothetical protein